MSIESGVLPDLVRLLEPANQERTSQQQLVLFFFAANEGDSQIADYDALRMAQCRPIFEQDDGGARPRRPLPPRRHLRG